MSVLVPGVLAFGILVVAHIVIWRMVKPAQQYTKLAALSVAVLGLSMGGFYAVQLASRQSVTFLPSSPFDYLNMALLYGALFLSYLTTYSAVQADSPTMAILLAIDESGCRGMNRAELLARFDDAVLVLPRIDDLVAGDLVRYRNGRYVIQPPGLSLAKVNIGYRRMLKLEKGG